MSVQAVALDQGLPANESAERSILGSILVENGLITETQSLTPDDFFTSGHQRIAAAMMELAAAGKPIDIVLLTDHFRAKKQLESVGGAAYLSDLTTGVPKRSSLEYYIKIVKDCAVARNLVRACNGIISEATEGCGSNVQETIAHLQEHLLNIEAQTQCEREYSLEEIMPVVMEDLRNEAQSNTGVVGFTTGIPALDEITTGIRPGELWVVGALPGRGKTGLGAQILRRNAQVGIPGVFFSLEMSRYQLGCRLLAASSTVSASQIRRPGYLARENWNALEDAVAKVARLPIWVNDASRLKLAQIMMRSKFHARRNKVKIIVVDYLMLVDAPGKELRERADAVARGMKHVAKSEHVAVVLLSQFKRPSNINDEPNETWFKESGGIEAEAEVALALHRIVGEGNTFTGEDFVYIVKQRNGERSRIPSLYHPKRLEWEERAI